MIDVQKGLGIQYIFDLVRKDIQGIYETKDFTKKQKRKYIRKGQEIAKNLHMVVCSWWPYGKNNKKLERSKNMQ